MADWTDPKTFASTELLTAGDLNTYVRDNTMFLYDTPAVTVRMTATQTVASGTDALISWSEAAWDTTGTSMWDAGSPGSILIPIAGVYRFTCATLWDDSTDANKRAIFLEKNGTTRLRGVQVPAVSPSEVILTGSTNVAANDYLEFLVRQLSGSPLDLQPTRTVCTVEFARPAP